MTSAANVAPTKDNVISDNGKINLSWLIFMNSLASGDLGSSWTPNFSGLTETGGTATKAGLVYKVIDRICFFRATITPVTSTTSTAGTTYIDNLPYIPFADGVCCAVNGTTGIAFGVVSAAANRIYVPSWSAITSPITILGIVEVS